MIDVLIADDDQDDQELIKAAIAQSRSTFSFHIVNNGREALDFLLSLPHDNLPCLIILDYSMPQMNGHEVLTSLYNYPRFKEIPKVVVSTSKNEVHVAQCIGSGALQYFVKPNNMKDLNVMVEEILGYCKN